ncbi:hypothetical protein GE09DRAFT_1273177 [Coniochaeta sp. 2T2.1]|nr:hypothetical protein GE09DRAFT_1273177 [Coniochaeta sp. 2T2.1]
MVVGHVEDTPAYKAARRASLLTFSISSSMSMSRLSIGRRIVASVVFFCLMRLSRSAWRRANHVLVNSPYLVSASTSCLVMALMRASRSLVVGANLATMRCSSALVCSRVPRCQLRRARIYGLVPYSGSRSSKRAARWSGGLMCVVESGLTERRLLFVAGAGRSKRRMSRDLPVAQQRPQVQCTMTVMVMMVDVDVVRFQVDSS